MNHGWLAPLNALALAAAAGSLASASLAAQRKALEPAAKKTVTAKTWKPSRTPDGQPDLHGIWVNNSATPLERPDALAGRALLKDEEVIDLKKRADRLFKDAASDFAAGDNAFLAVLANAEHYDNPNRTIESALEMEGRDFDNRTSLIVTPADGKIPFTPEGKRRQAAAVEARLHPAPADPEDLPNDLRCITFGVPRLGGNGAGYNSYYQIEQTPGYVILFGEVIHDARVIPLDGRPHLPSSVRPWNGDSRGRWDGLTLVVDTTNFSNKSYFLGSTEHLHLVERFTRVAEDTIDYEISASDPGAWTQSWTAVVHLKQTQNRMYEYACHEGNYQIMVDMLAGANATKRVMTEPSARPRQH
jgi:hypothetical protein